MTYAELFEICAEISLSAELVGCPRVKIGFMGEGFFVQIAFNQKFMVGEEYPPTSWTSRKWYVSPHSTTSEVVLTVLKCWLTLLEHEGREGFTYKGETVFNPHVNVETLVDLCRGKGAEDRRADTVSR
jgi:hypothetical protein